jgi:hypothetical protein
MIRQANASMIADKSFHDKYHANAKALARGPMQSNRITLQGNSLFRLAQKG